MTFARRINILGGVKKGKPKKRMGRPPLPPDEKLSERVTVWLSVAERQHFEEQARLTGRSLSEAIMARWREEDEDVRLPDIQDKS